MSKKTFMAIIILLFSILVLSGTQIFRETRANFVPNFPPSNKDPPILEVLSPQNYTTCNVSSILLNFTVSKPVSWGHQWIGPSGMIDCVNVTLNGELKFHDDGDYVSGISISNESYSVYVKGLKLGANTIQVSVLAHTFYLSVGWYNGTEMSGTYDYPMSVTDTINLNSTVSPPSSNIEYYLTPLTIIISIIVAIAAVIIVTTVYFRRTEKQK
jgi:hypothetical protein